MLIKVIFVLLAALLLMGALVLQGYLSLRERRWPGLVLPGVDLLLAAAAALCAPGPAAATSGFLLMMAPLAIHLLLYFNCREKLRARWRMAEDEKEDQSMG